MRIISIGNDPKMFELGSAVAKRQVEYGKMFEKMDIVVFSNRITNYESRIKLSENVFVYPTNSRNKLFCIFDAFRIVKSIIHNSKFIIQDTVISTQDPFETGLIGVFLKLKFNIPLQVQLHTDFNNKYFLLSSPLNFIRFFLAHLVLPYADSVRVVSNKVKESIKELNSNITVLPIRIESGIMNYELRKNTGNQKILTVARLEKEKDLETAIKAFAEVGKKFPEARFTIVGDGSQKIRLQMLAHRLQLNSRIKFVGWQNDLSLFYNSHSIYISTSLFEGYGMSMVEAAKNGLALALSEAGVARELPALISKPKDVRSFAESLEKLLADRSLVEEMGEKAKEVSERMVVNKEEYLLKYKKTLEQTISTNRNFIKSVFKGNKILRFIVAGGTAASSQIISLYIFTDIFKIWYLHSSVLSFMIALVISFLLQKFWAFRDHGTEIVHIQFFKYTLIAVSGLAFNTLLMYFWVSALGLWYILAQIITGVMIAVYNFFMYRKFIFPP